MPWFFFILWLSFSFNNFSEGGHDQKQSAVVVGTVYCDTCFLEDFSRTSHFISGASVAVECKDGTSRPSIRQEVKTNEHGAFKVHLPFSVGKHVRKIKGCSVKLVRSSEPHCAVASTATSSSLHLKSRNHGTHIFSAGVFTFKPLKRPSLCDQKSSVQNPKQLKNKEPSGENVVHPELFFSTPSVFQPDDPVPAPPILSPNQFLAPPILPPNPFQPPPLLPPNPFQPPPLLPPIPFEPPPAPLIPNPFQPPPAPLIPNPFQPPPAPLIPNPFQPPPAPLFPPNPFQPPPAPPAPFFPFPPIPGLTPPPSSPPPLFPPNPFQPPPAPPAPFFPFPPIPGLTPPPSPPPPPPPAFPFPLPPFPFPPIPPFPGIPPASTSPKKSSP